MKIAVISAFDLSQKKAWALNSVKMAHGFAKNGHEVHLICRKCKDNKTTEEQFLQNFAVDSHIHVHPLPHFFGENVLFAFGAFFVCLKEGIQAVYARNYTAPILTSLKGIPTAVESHAHPGNRSPFYKMHLWAMRTLKNTKAWITISSYLKKHYSEDLAVPVEKINVMADAVDEKLFARPENLPKSPYASDAKNITYAGHLYDYKGIPTVLEAAKELPEHHFHFVGGFPEDVERHKAYCEKHGMSNCTFHGYMVHKDIPSYLWHSDALLLPPSLNHPSAKWTSPMKLGEYLLAGVPVICSNIPALDEWVTEDEVLFFDADNSNSLIKTIKNAFSEPQAERIQNGINLTKTMTYKYRSNKILELCMK